MKFEQATISFLAFASMTIASPVKTLYNRNTLDQCEAASNCEVYEGPHGAAIRFKEGMEPGSDHYSSIFPNTTTMSILQRSFQLQKRNTQTHVSLGKESINYGTMNPCDVVHHLYDTCHEGACDQSAFQVTGTFDLQCTGRSCGPRSRTITIYPDGQYNGWDARNNFVDAVVVVASKEQKWTRHDWTVFTKEGEDSGTQWWGEQTNFMSVNRFYNGALHGFMSVRVEMDGSDADWCAKLLGPLAAIAGAINPIAGGFFGFASGFCG